MDPEYARRTDRMWVIILAASFGWIPVLCVTDSPTAVASYALIALIVVSVAAYAAKEP